MKTLTLTEVAHNFSAVMDGVDFQDVPDLKFLVVKVPL